MAHNQPPGGRSTYYVARGGAEDAALELETNPGLLDLRCCCTEARSLALPDLRRFVDALARHPRIERLALEGFRRAVLLKPLLRCCPVSSSSYTCEANTVTEEAISLD
jgi:hypothetical protein